MILFFLQIYKLYMAFINYFQLLENCIKSQTEFVHLLQHFLSINLATEIS